MPDPLIQLTALRRRFREGDRSRSVIDGVDLAVAAGECVALLGRSGSGKSTLLNLIAGIDRPDAGRVCIAGADLTAMDERARTLFRRRHIGFVYQFFNLIPTLTVLENVMLPLELNGQGPKGARVAAQAMLEAVDLGDRPGAWPDRLSGGEQQRVALARALVHRPRLILADEPTGNLDADSGTRVLELLARLVREQGQTLVLVTHSRQVSSRTDRVVTLEGGRITDHDAEVVW